MEHILDAASHDNFIFIVNIVAYYFILTNILDWCMQFVQTNMGEQVNRVLVDALGGFLKMEDVINGTVFLT